MAKTVDCCLCEIYEKDENVRFYTKRQFGKIYENVEADVNLMILDETCLRKKLGNAEIMIK